jgi:hypothetical protein
MGRVASRHIGSGRFASRVCIAKALDALDGRLGWRGVDC